MPIDFNDDGKIIRVKAETVAEAKLVAKALKLKKKEIQLQKKELSTEIARLRANHRTAMAAATSPVRVGGTFGKVMRGMEKANKVTARNGLERQVVPLEEQKLVCDKNIASIDECLLQLEIYILRESKTA